MSKRKHSKKVPGLGTFKVADLRAACHNPRSISPEALEGLTRSVERFGLVQPIVVNVKGKKPAVIGGNQRLKVLETLGVAEAVCVTVSVTKAEEKLLNLTLNNPKIQGEFSHQVFAYIERLRSENAMQGDLVSLKILQLQTELSEANQASDGETAELEYSEQKLRPYRRTHILLSFEPSVFEQLEPHLAEIRNIKGVEYEQGSN